MSSYKPKLNTKSSKIEIPKIFHHNNMGLKKGGKHFSNVNFEEEKKRHCVQFQIP